MEIGERIRKIRESKKMSQKEVTVISGVGTAMYSRIESGKTEPSITTLEKIALALRVGLSDFFHEDAPAQDVEVNTYDSSLMERVKLIDTLPDEEKKTVFSIVDAFVGKRKLKNALQNVLQDAV